MHVYSKLSLALIIVLLVTHVYTTHAHKTHKPALNAKNHKKITIQCILGSTRQNRLSEKIARELIQSLPSSPSVTLEIVDLREYALPFLDDAVPPAQRTQITDPAVAAWSHKIQQADAFIIISPEYNAGYPGVLKNALDSLFVEWNNKPVAFVTYSGGPSGGASVLKQLHTVVNALKMVHTFDNLQIPSSWKAFNAQGDLQDTTLATKFAAIVDQIVAACNT